MKRALCLVAVLLMAGLAGAQAAKVKPAPALMVNAKYVYVTSYDGPEFSPDLLPQDRQAIADVREAIQKWGHYINVYDPKEADLIIAVQSRENEDILAVYEPTFGPDSSPIWRQMQRGGLQQGEMPLMSKLQKAVELAADKKGRG